MNDSDVAAAILRLIVGGTILAHGLNHVFGGGKLAGTAGWFESIGLRPGRVHAVAASVAEVVGGTMLLAGFLTPFAAAAVIGTMVVAYVTNHRRNGFFIFRPGEGYEYILMIAVVGVAIAVLGGGSLSTDAVLGIADDLNGPIGAATAIVGGVSGAAITLGFGWRPASRPHVQ